MTAKEYLEYIVQQIHTTVVATVDEEGLPGNQGQPQQNNHQYNHQGNGQYAPQSYQHAQQYANPGQYSTPQNYGTPEGYEEYNVSDGDLPF